MTDPNILFCNSLKRETMKDVRAHVEPALIEEAWIYRYPKDGAGNRTAEFQIPSVEFYWYGSAYCASEAWHKGWSAYLQHIGVEGYE